MTIYQPYTYLIGWTKQDKWYYGVRYANRVSPEFDLWKVYFTSSNYVTEFRKMHGEPDVVTIDKIFDDVDSAVAYETQYLVENEVLGNTKWLNKNAAGAIVIDEDVRAKMQKSALRRVSEGTHHYLGNANNKKRVEDGTHNFLGGEMQRHAQLENVKNGTHHLLGGDIARKLLGEGRHPSQKEYICPTCGKEGKGNSMLYYHFDNCGVQIHPLKGKQAPTKGSIWINNGSESKRCPSDQSIPLGWKKGRAKK